MVHSLLMKWWTKKNPGGIREWKYRRDTFKDCCCSSLIITCWLSISGNEARLKKWESRLGVLERIWFCSYHSFAAVQSKTSTWWWAESTYTPFSGSYSLPVNYRWCSKLVTRIIQVNGTTCQNGKHLEIKLQFLKKQDHHCTAHVANGLYREKCCLRPLLEIRSGGGIWIMQDTTSGQDIEGQKRHTWHFCECMIIATLVPMERCGQLSAWNISTTMWQNCWSRKWVHQWLRLAKKCAGSSFVPSSYVINFGRNPLWWGSRIPFS